MFKLFMLILGVSSAIGASAPAEKCTYSPPERNVSPNEKCDFSPPEKNISPRAASPVDKTSDK